MARRRGNEFIAFIAKQVDATTANYTAMTKLMVESLEINREVAIINETKKTGILGKIYCEDQTGRFTDTATMTGALSATLLDMLLDGGMAYETSTDNYAQRISATPAYYTIVKRYTDGKVDVIIGAVVTDSSFVGASNTNWQYSLSFTGVDSDYEKTQTITSVDGDFDPTCEAEFKFSDTSMDLLDGDIDNAQSFTFGNTFSLSSEDARYGNSDTPIFNDSIDAISTYEFGYVYDTTLVATVYTNMETGRIVENVFRLNDGTNSYEFILNSKILTAASPDSGQDIMLTTVTGENYLEASQIAFGVIRTDI